MDLLKLSPLDEKYCHFAMEGLVGLFKVSKGFKNHTWGIRVVRTICIVRYQGSFRD